MKHIGLILSGGMGKGAYQIGALNALSEFFQPSDFEYVSAASIGALNAYAYLTGNLKRACEIWQSADFQGRGRFITSILRSTFFHDAIGSLASGRTIPTSLYVPLLDLANRELDYYNFAGIFPDEIEPYLRASVALPFYNQGVAVNSKTLFDGAVVDNIPIYPVLRNKLDYVICIYFDDSNYIFEDDALEDKIIKLTFPDQKRISSSVYISHESVMRMMEEGYQKTMQALAPIFSDGVDALDAIHARIAERNLAVPQRTLRLTGDVVVTNMNRLVQKVVRHGQRLSGDALSGQVAQV